MHGNPYHGLMKKQPRRDPMQVQQLRKAQLEQVQGGSTQPVAPTTASARDANLFS